jgi:hypothetical protein
MEMVIGLVRESTICDTTSLAGACCAGIATARMFIIALRRFQHIWGTPALPILIGI